MRLQQLPAVIEGTDRVNVVIDTPRGSRNKYKFDETDGVFRLSRILPSGMSWPGDFGSIPRTRAPDGEALDCLVLVEEPSFTGAVLPVRLIGVLHALQTEQGREIRNDRLVGVPETSVNPARVRSLAELGDTYLHELELFFVHYNAVQGRPVRFEARGDAAEAWAAVQQAMREEQGGA